MPAPKKTLTKTPSKKVSTGLTVAPMPAKTAAAPIAPMTAMTVKTAAPETKKTDELTRIVAQIDIGFGNRLTIRGQGAGLSWHKSEPMEWEKEGWTWQTSAKENFEFKTLLNDKAWQQGYNVHAKAGQKIVFKPQF